MKPPKHLQGGQLNLTPMIDVVFLLIIFFIVSNNMIQQDNALPINLPAAETGVFPEDQKHPKRLTISIPPSGMIHVGTVATSKTALSTLMAEYRTLWGEEVEIRIRTDKNVLYGEINPILRMAAENGIVRVSFAVTDFTHPI
jgi:biopolymer transport protein ExbD